MGRKRKPIKMDWIEPHDPKRLSRAMAQLSLQTGRSMTQVTQQTAVWFCQSARKVTPMAPPRREIERVAVSDVEPTKRWMVRDGRWVYNIIKYDKAGQIVKIPTADKDDPRRKIKQRGAAKNAWSGCIRKLFKSAPTSGTSSPALAADLSDVKNYRSKTHAVTEVANQVRYIEILDRGGPNNPPNHIMSRAMSSATKRIEGAVKNAYKKQAEKFWR